MESLGSFGQNIFHHTKDITSNLKKKRFVAVSYSCEGVVTTRKPMFEEKTLTKKNVWFNRLRFQKCTNCFILYTKYLSDIF